MPIELIDKIKQKNNGDFKLIDVEDVDGIEEAEFDEVDFNEVISANPNVTPTIGMSKITIEGITYWLIAKSYLDGTTEIDLATKINEIVNNIALISNSLSTEYLKKTGGDTAKINMVRTQTVQGIDATTSVGASLVFDNNGIYYADNLVNSKYTSEYKLAVKKDVTGAKSIYRYVPSSAKTPIYSENGGGGYSTSFKTIPVDLQVSGLGLKIDIKFSFATKIYWARTYTVMTGTTSSEVGYFDLNVSDGNGNKFEMHGYIGVTTSILSMSDITSSETTSIPLKVEEIIIQPVIQNTL